MKTGWYIVTIIVFGLASVLTGYFWAKSKEKPVVISAALDREIVANIDSFKNLISGKEDSLEFLKIKLSSFSKKPVKLEEIPSGDSLRRDIFTFQKIVRAQDTLRKIDARQITYITSELYKKNDQLANLQYRFNSDIEKQKRTRVNIFLSGIGVGVGASILIAVLIL